MPGNIGRAVTGRSVLVVATVVAAAGVAFGGGFWVAADESDRELRRSTTLTPGQARRLAIGMVREQKALEPRFVGLALHKLAHGAATLLVPLCPSVHGRRGRPPTC